MQLVDIGYTLFVHTYRIDLEFEFRCRHFDQRQVIESLTTPFIRLLRRIVTGRSQLLTEEVIGLTMTDRVRPYRIEVRCNRDLQP